VYRSNSVSSRALRFALVAALLGSMPFVSAGPVAAGACTKNWANTSVSGSWLTAGNWSPSGVPTNGDAVCLPGTGTYTVTIDNSTTAAANVLFIGAGATLAITGTTGASTLTVSNGVGNSGTLQMGTGGASTSHSATNLTITSGTLTNSGTIQSLGLGNTITSNINNANSGSIVTTGPLNFSKASGTFSNYGTITVGGQLTLIGPQTFNLGGGTITNNFIFSMVGGTFSHTAGSSVNQPLQLNGVTLNVNPPTGSAKLLVTTGTNVLNSDVGANETLIVRGGTSNSDGVLTSHESRTNNGTIQLSTGDAIHSAQLLFDATKTLTNNGTLETIAGGGGPDRVIQANVSNLGNLNIKNPTNFNGASRTLTQDTPGVTDLEDTLDLTGSSGLFTVDGGTVVGDGTLIGDLSMSSGTLAPGVSPGILTIDGDYSQSSGATLQIQIGGSNPGTQSDRLVVTGNANLNGTLALSRVNFTPTNSFTYDFLTYASHSGSFSTIAGITIGSGKIWAVSYMSTLARLSVTTASITRQPDALIAVGSGTFAGNNIYNTDAAGQSKSKTGNVGDKFVFKIKVQNDGTGANDRFTAHATGSTVAGYTIKYKKGTNNITTDVVNGTFTSGLIAPGNSITIKAIVTIGSGAAHGSSVTRLVTLTSVNDLGAQDVVKLTVGRT
jgi:fibronectin-binding autotransporter adhesin